MPNQKNIIDVISDIPFASEMYWRLRFRGKELPRKFSLQRIEKYLPTYTKQAQEALQRLESQPPSYTRRRIMIFSMLRMWMEHAALLGTALAGMGHDVSLTFMPHMSWHRRINPHHLAQRNAHAKRVLGLANPLLKSISLLDIMPEGVQSNTLRQWAKRSLPDSLRQALQEVALLDTQYTLQIEDVDCNGNQTPSARLYNMRLERNIHAACAALTWIKSLGKNQIPDLILVPNGSILEMGAIYQVAKYLDIPTVTYEFGEQRERIWLAQNAQVMLQETDALWAATKNHSLTEAQWNLMRDLYASRQNARLWENFYRLWQGLPSQGGEQVRKMLNLDSRPIVLLAANVIGDSLTLGRQIFSNNMTEWLERTVHSFAQRSDAQLVIRMHPGERYTKGPSVSETIRRALPEIPQHIHLVEASDPVNTYDLVEIADLGLVYTTTVGMEMSMSGVPVIVIGRTHYRGKGFTLDPTTWVEYEKMLEEALSNHQKIRLTHNQIERAWHYAYRFFFNYPCPFPWHLRFWHEADSMSMERALSEEGQAMYGDTFRYLAGEPRVWSNV